MPGKVAIGFERKPIVVPLGKLLMTRKLPEEAKRAEKYQRILASIREVGIIEPLIVHPQSGKGASGTYLLLDGHLRAEALAELGMKEAPCLVSTDDEGYTYNHHVNRLSSFQEHFMLMKALSEGVPEERLARALNVDLQKLREKKDLLRGISEEAVELLRSKDLGAKTLHFFRRVKPLRQFEMAELMNASNNYSCAYARALYLATQRTLLADPEKPKEAEGISPEDIARMEKEMESLEEDFRLVEEAYSRNMLDLVVAQGYLKRLLDNARVVRFLVQRYPEFLNGFQKVVEAASLEA
ncbi:MAG: ParB N-terminal domain-containing protein [Deltaproteobacteria bacterium]|nr:ParB N-terminal domain-containing protein [Deltaproteobacteria bacterium]